MNSIYDLFEFDYDLYLFTPENLSRWWPKWNWLWLLGRCKRGITDSQFEHRLSMIWGCPSWRPSINPYNHPSFCSRFTPRFNPKLPPACKHGFANFPDILMSYYTLWALSGPIRRWTISSIKYTPIVNSTLGTKPKSSANLWCLIWFNATSIWESVQLPAKLMPLFYFIFRYKFEFQITE